MALQAVGWSCGNRHTQARDIGMASRQGQNTRAEQNAYNQDDRSSMHNASRELTF